MSAEVVFLLFASAVVVAAPVLAAIALVRVILLEREVRRSGLAARVAALERALRRVGAEPREAPAAPPAGEAAPRPPAPPPAREAPPPPAPTPAPGPTAPTVPAAPPSSPPAARGSDLEALIAGRWMNRVGIVALLLAAAFFLKFAFDNEWIGPRGRVAIGLLAGTALLVYAERLSRRGWIYFAEGLTGLGAGVLYLSLYAAWGFYALVPLAAAFTGMVAVTATLAAIALGRESQRLALLALAGGFLTPVLLSSGVDRQVALFTYLALLNAGLVGLAHLRRWRSLEPVALGATLVHFFAWFAVFYETAKLAPTLLFATLLFAEFSVLPVVRLRRGDAATPERIGVVLANAGWYLVALDLLLYRDHRWALTFAVLALAAVHVLAARLVRLAPATRVARGLFGGIALALVTVAIPIRLEGRWLVMAWAVEGTALVRTGLRASLRTLRLTGLGLLGWAVLLLIGPAGETVPRLLLNGRFATFAVTVGALLVAAAMSRRAAVPLPAEERPLYAVAAVGGNLLALIAFSLEVWDFLGRVAPDVNRELARQLGLSSLWAVWAALLIAGGVRVRSAPLRWQGIAVMGVVVAKVFLLDLSFLQRGFRIVSFCVLGVLLLLVSFHYQRRRRGGDAGEARP